MQLDAIAHVLLQQVLHSAPTHPDAGREVVVSISAPARNRTQPKRLEVSCPHPAARASFTLLQ